MCKKSDLVKIRVLNRLKVKANMNKITVWKDCVKPSAQIQVYSTEDQPTEEQKL